MRRSTCSAIFSEPHKGQHQVDRTAPQIQQRLSVSLRLRSWQHMTADDLRHQQPVAVLGLLLNVLKPTGHTIILVALNI